mgnify:CR=1 FL=1
MQRIPMSIRRSGVMLALLSTLFFLTSGCGKDGDIRQSDSGRISVSPLTVAFPNVALGEKATKTLTISNAGEAKLTIFDLEFKAKKDATIEDLKILDKPKGEFTVGPDKSKELEIEYAPVEAGRPNEGVIKIPNSDQSDPIEVDVTTLGNRPRMQVSPPTVRFPRIPAGDRTERKVTVENVGNAPLELFEKPSITSDSDYRVKNVDTDFPETLNASGTGEEGSNALTLTIEYAPTEDGSDEAELLLKSNEKGGTEEEPDVKRVDITANADSPCILIDSTKRNLGAVPLGGTAVEPITIESCGSKALEIQGIEIAKNSKDDEFELKLGQRDGNGDGRLDEPIVLEKRGDRVNLAVEYEPAQAGSDKATVLVRNNDPAQPEAEVDIAARGSDGECPKTEVVAKVKGESGVWKPSITAAPLDRVILDGSGSQDPDGTIEEYKWRVIEKPDGSTVNLDPTDSAPGDDAKREFRLLTAGTYKIGLQVTDNDGFVSCQEAKAQVTAVPNEKVHVELTWVNPEDPDETDENGSDVDVHLVKMGPGKWFEAPYDIYFRNPNNGAGNTGTGIWNPENPSLDIDDTNGAGPENIQMDDPEDCQWYAVGVHYYEQLFGTAYATIRIYINSKLVYEKLNQPLRQGGQFWDVARIHWPTGQVYDVDDLQPASPVEKKPAVTNNMQSSGLCTMENLY